METKVKHDQRNHIQNDRTLKVDGSQSTTIGKGRTTQITTGNEMKTVLAGSDLETISLLKSTTAKEIFQYAQDRIELEVGKQTSITMDNEKILLRFGKNTILMNEEGIWLDGVHIGLQEKELTVPDNQHPTPYRLQYQFLDDDGQPFENSKYTVELPDGSQYQGITDKNGLTKVYYSSENGQKTKFYLHIGEE